MTTNSQKTHTKIYIFNSAGQVLVKTKNIITRGFKKIYDYKFFIKRLKTGNDC